MKDIKEAIEIVEEIVNDLAFRLDEPIDNQVDQDVHNIEHRKFKALQTVIDFYKRVESVKGLPEKEAYHNSFNGGYTMGTPESNAQCEAFHHGMDVGLGAIDDCRIYIAKMQGKIERLKKDIELLELYLKNTRNDVAKMLDEGRIIKTIVQCRESKIINNRRLVIYNEADLEKIAKALVKELGGK